MSFHKNDTMLVEALKALQPTPKMILEHRPMDFNDETYEPFQFLLDEPMRQVVNVYMGRNTFLHDMKRKNPWTVRQSRAVANILLRQLRLAANKVTAPTAASPLKVNAPKQAPAGQSLGHAKPVLPTFQPIHNINLREIPEGRYAIPGSQPGEWNFYIITKLKRNGTLRGRFRWGAQRGRTYVHKGDLTVRKQVGDTKELIGMQSTKQDFYHGDYEVDLLEAHRNPGKAMQEYGRIMKRCAYCSRSLTDEVSRMRGIGPDCYENKHLPFLNQRAYS